MYLIVQGPNRLWLCKVQDNGFATRVSEFESGTDINYALSLARALNESGDPENKWSSDPDHNADHGPINT